MRLTITAGDVKVIIDRGMDESMVDFAVLEYTNATEPGADDPYTVTATADSIDELRLLLEAAEPDGPVRSAVANVLDRTEKLFDEWRAAIANTRKSEGAK